MAENLRTTRFNDGTSITNLVGCDAWVSLTTPAYCWYNNDSALGKLQETGYTHWIRQNPGATNSSGFTALPCGCLIGSYSPVTFQGLGGGTNWYSSSLNSDLVLVWAMGLSYPSSYLALGIVTKTPGFSIRCIKD